MLIYSKIMDAEIKSWDPIWETVFQTQEWGKYPGESLIQFIARNFYSKDREKIKLLELGCGTGANIWFMSREGFDVTGIDGSQTAINKAKERLFNEKLNAQLIVGDIIKLPFQNMEFDGIVDNECLCCNTEPNTLLILSEVNRLLNSNGLFYSRTFAKEMHPDESQNEHEFEFSNITEGVFRGKGFIRLIDEQKIKSLYGRFLKIISIDKIEYTQYNGSQRITEYIIVCQKK
jgi:SAM-dependent methyltransferase